MVRFRKTRSSLPRTSFQFVSSPRNGASWQGPPLAFPLRFMELYPSNGPGPSNIIPPAIYSSKRRSRDVDLPPSKLIGMSSFDSDPPLDPPCSAWNPLGPLPPFHKAPSTQLPPKFSPNRFPFPLVVGRIPLRCCPFKHKPSVPRMRRFWPPDYSSFAAPLFFAGTVGRVFSTIVSLKSFPPGSSRNSSPRDVRC